MERKRDGGEERGVRGGSETRGFRRQAAGSLSLRPTADAAGTENTVLFRRTLSPGFVFLSRGRAPSRWSPLREFVFALLSSLLLCRPLIVGRMSPSLSSVRACLSHNSICKVCVCVCGFCVCCVFFLISFTS